MDQLPDVTPQLYADNLKCVSSRPEQLLRAAQFTSAYVRLVGQEPAPSKCVLMSTSAAVRRDMKDWVVFAQDERSTVKMDVRDLGGHLDTTYRAWGCTLVARVVAVLGVVWLGLCFTAWFTLVSFVFFVPCIFLLLCMELKPLISLRVVFSS